MFGIEDAYALKKIKFSKEKHTFKIDSAHLELRSPVFGELCIASFLKEMD